MYGTFMDPLKYLKSVLCVLGLPLCFEIHINILILYLQTISEKEDVLSPPRKKMKSDIQDTSGVCLSDF